MLCVVVFYHPGREYPVNGAPKFRETKPKVMPWNSEPYHRRKFLMMQTSKAAATNKFSPMVNKHKTER